MALHDDVEAGSTAKRRAWALRLPRVDPDLRRRVVNVGHLLSGNGITGALAVVGAGLTARSLGPAEYGVLALVVSYGRIFDRLMRFESWQPLIKYAAEPVPAAEDRQERLRALFALGLWLDVAACTAAAVASIVLVLLAGPYFGLDQSHIWLVVINAVGLLLNINGMPTAVLRLAGRFSTIAYLQVTGGILRIVLCAIGAWTGGGLLYFITAWTVSQIFSSLLFLGIAMLEIHRQRIGRLLSVPLRGITRRFPGIMGFAWSSSFSISIRTSAMELDVLVVGALVDPAAAGLYFIAKQVAKAVQQLCSQVQAVLYPDVTRLWAQGSFAAFRRAVTQVQWALDVFALSVIAFIALAGPKMLEIVAGHEFAAAYKLLLVQMFALALTMHTAPLRSALLAMGEQRTVLRIVFWSTLVFQALLFILTSIAGAVGANVAHVVLALLNALQMERATRRRFHSIAPAD